MCEVAVPIELEAELAKNIRVIAISRETQGRWRCDLLTSELLFKELGPLF